MCDKSWDLQQRNLRNLLKTQKIYVMMKLKRL